MAVIMLVRRSKLRQPHSFGTRCDMSDYDPSELMVVCESIIEDGELTYDELYRLADWLNNHHDACLHWPGNLLVEPLQKAWADGKITKTEARQLARIILQIRKGAAKREAEEEALAQAAKIASQAAHTFDLTRPNLPTIPFATHVKSHTKRGFLRGQPQRSNVHLPGFPFIPSQTQRRTSDTLLQTCVSCLRSTWITRHLAWLARRVPRLSLATSSSEGMARSVDPPRLAYLAAARVGAHFFGAKPMGGRFRFR